VDGQPVEITPSNPHGFVNFPVSAGEHGVRLFLGSTPARDAGKAATVLAVFGIGATMFYVRCAVRRGDLSGRPSVCRRPHEHPNEREPILPRLGLLAGLALTTALVAVFFREGLAWVHSPPGRALVAQHQVVYNLGEKVQLIGYDLNADRFSPGDRLELVVYWYTREKLSYKYQSFVHVSTGGPPLAQADRENPAGRPTKKWTPDGYIRDEYVISLPPTIPPGEYRLLVGLYTCDTLPAGQCGNGDRLAVADAQGKALGDAVLLQMVTVR
jgi:hypothetical protein